MEWLFEFFEAGSIGSVLLRGAIWIVLMIILAAGANKEKSTKDIKAEAGWFFIFLFAFGTSGFLLYRIPILF